MADAAALGAADREVVQVRVLSPAPGATGSPRLHAQARHAGRAGRRSLYSTVIPATHDKDAVNTEIRDGDRSTIVLEVEFTPQELQQRHRRGRAPPGAPHPRAGLPPGQGPSPPPRARAGRRPLRSGGSPTPSTTRRASTSTSAPSSRPSRSPTARSSSSRASRSGRASRRASGPPTGSRSPCGRRSSSATTRTIPSSPRSTR